MEKKKFNKKILIVVIAFIIALVIITSISILNNNSKRKLTGTQVQNIVIQKVNNNDIYIDDVGKVKNINNVKYVETIDNIEYWKMDIEYELCSLNAPIGKDYSETSLSGTFCFACNTEIKKSYEYMFEINEYETLKGWSKTNKDNSNSWK